MDKTEFLSKASTAYYEGEPIISDQEFDFLADMYTEVGQRTTNSDISHYVRMYSLQKAYVGDSSFPLDHIDSLVVKTPKLDGAALSLLYSPDGSGNAVLCNALSRGDGRRGKYIFNNIKHKVPNIIKYDYLIQINCEIVAPRDISANPRNYAAGALSLKDVNEFKSRDLTVVAIDASPIGTATYEDTLLAMQDMGFTTVNSKSFDLASFPTDGVVYRVNDQKLFKSLGYTDRYPKGAFALKRQAEGVWTTLKAVSWNVGRTGVVTPVAHLETVEIEGSKISRAALHNFAHIQALELKIGDEVKIIRSGEIIPKIIGRRDGLSI